MNSQFTNRELTPLDYQYIILFYFLSLILTPFQGAKIDYMTMPIITIKTQRKTAHSIERGAAVFGRSLLGGRGEGVKQ